MSTQSHGIHAGGQDGRFIANAGTSLATWGLGTCLLLLRLFAPVQAKALPIILIPIAAFALGFALLSSNSKKREDASHIHLLALAGSMAPFGLASTAYYHYVIAASLVALNLANARRSLQVAPFGPTVIFVALLSPASTDLVAVTFLCITILACTTFIGRGERQVATSVFPLLASLHFVAHVRPERHWALGLLALAHIGVLYHLRQSRLRHAVAPTERRVLLDEVVVAYALSITLMAWTSVAEHVRYGFVGLLFFTAAALRSLGDPTQDLRSTNRRWMSLVRWVASDNPMRMRASAVTAGLCLVAAIVHWPVALEPTAEVSLRAALVLAIAACLHWLGRNADSFVQKDAAKLLLAYASLKAYGGITASTIGASTALSLVVLGVVQYAAIVLAVLAAGHDLGKKGQGAWQGIVSGRALAMIRRTRSRVFDIVSQAPLVGWMFHLSDKAAANLQGTFGASKTWTIAHYVICLTVALGAISAVVLTTELFIGRLPNLASEVIALSDAEKTLNLRTSLARLIAIVGYATAVFVAGALLFKSYLRALALILACFLIAIEAFGALSDTRAISIFFYPLALCGLMALFRVFYRAERRHSTGA